jgi:hypothetical protein
MITDNFIINFFTLEKNFENYQIKQYNLSDIPTIGVLEFEKFYFVIKNKSYNTLKLNIKNNSINMDQEIKLDPYSFFNSNDFSFSHNVSNNFSIVIDTISFQINHLPWLDLRKQLRNNVKLKNNYERIIKAQ